MGIHLPGLRNLDKPVVWVFPALSICLDCGIAEFVMPDAERQKLKGLDSDQTSIARAS